MCVWALVSELSEQLSQNRSTSVNLRALTDGFKVRRKQYILKSISHSVDKPKEVYKAELERMNATMSAENHTFLNDNLRKRHFERVTEAPQETLIENNACSESLVRISRLLRAVLRRLGGEDIQAYKAYLRAQAWAAKTPQSREASSTHIEAGPSQPAPADS
ncbi:hypothetical protein ACG7TL_006735 [Trametes sanguinea]